MAGNIVKWWKHKIHGGYKQFSVQECTTDSEELMYHQVRVSSSCSAPPDLLMVSDRENNIPLRSPVVNLISTATTTTAAAHHSSAAVGCSSAQKHHQQLNHATGQQQQQQQAAHRDPHQQHCSKDGSGKQHLKLSSKSAASKFINAQQQLAVGSQQQQQQQQQQPDEIDGQQQTAHQRHSSHQHGKEEGIRLEEFTCDVSVEGGKSTQAAVLLRLLRPRRPSWQNHQGRHCRHRLHDIRVDRQVRGGATLRQQNNQRPPHGYVNDEVNC